MPVKTFQNLTAAMVLADKHICWSTEAKDLIIRFCATTGLCERGLNADLLRVLMVQLNFTHPDKEVYRSLAKKVIGFIKRNVNEKTMKPALTTTKIGTAARMAPYRVQWKQYAVDWAADTSKTDLLKNHDGPAGVKIEDLAVGLTVEFPWISEKMLEEVVVEEVFANEHAPEFLPERFRAAAQTTAAPTANPLTANAQTVNVPATTTSTAHGNIPTTTTANGISNAPAPSVSTLPSLLDSRWAPNAAQIDLATQQRDLANQQSAIALQQRNLASAQAQLDADRTALAEKEAMFHAAEAKRRQTSYLDPLINGLSQALGHKDSDALKQYLECDVDGTVGRLSEWIVAGQETEKVIEDLEEEKQGLRKEVGSLEDENAELKKEVEELKTMMAGASVQCGGLVLDADATDEEEEQVVLPLMRRRGLPPLSKIAAGVGKRGTKGRERALA
ncbi:hypothetical protein Tdes44962_MAKER03133 [Teratosphaeria destructans]|uniref:Uncharacterized protein n=1 Tax=Teratosphaeria destructans TaxID=418781 RepID=A0A9W7SQQ5_9PEZI|nr:hypothetical protein Tdes44962_MAKER03133 [Teratosphaeria destructans]